MNTSKVTRFEIINHSSAENDEVVVTKGRTVIHWSSDKKLELSLQDEGRTLKVFISDKNAPISKAENRRILTAKEKKELDKTFLSMARIK